VAFERRAHAHRELNAGGAAKNAGKAAKGLRDSLAR